MSKVISVKSESEFNLYLSKPNRLIVVDYHAKWCGPCQRIAPLYNSLSVKHSSKHIDFLKVNVDELESVAKRFKVNSMPTFQFFKNGVMLTQFSGADANLLRSNLDNLIWLKLT